MHGNGRYRESQGTAPGGCRKCSRNLELPDDDEHVRELYARAREEVTALLRVADDPISIGMVGEFSKGKSLLLGTLMGEPDMLPVERRATTGNVTALHLAPDTSSAVTVSARPPRSTT